MKSSYRWISKVFCSLSFVAVIFVCGTAHATILLDHSPLTTGATISNNYWSNGLAFQSFAENISFKSGVTITGIDIYGGYHNAIGDQATVRLWEDNDGQPGALLNTINTTLSIIDNDGATSGNYRKHADIAPLLLAADTTYWIGMTGTELTQTALYNVDDNQMAQFNGGSVFSYFASVGDMAFRLEGDNSNAVPEPSTFLLLGVGFLSAGLLRKRVRM